MKKLITKGQRYEISVLLQAGHGKSYIAEKLKVHESTIRREIKNNCDKRSGEYNPELAQRKSEARMSSRNHFTKMDDAMKEKIDLLLYEGWSPEQIHGRLKYEGVDIVSHETIYKYVYEDKRLKGNGKGLYKHLRRKGRKYAKRGNQYKGRGIIVDRVDIDQRPNIVNENIRFGDLEGDTIIGKNRKGAIETIIDRHTGFLWMSKLSRKEGQTRMQTDSLGNTSLKDLTLPKCPTIILQRYKTSSTTDQERDWDSGLLLRSLECYILNIFNIVHYQLEFS